MPGSFIGFPGCHAILTQIHITLKHSSRTPAPKLVFEDRSLVTERATKLKLTPMDLTLELLKSFPILERLRLTMRFEALDVFNNPEFSNPNSGNSNIPSPSFGNITSTSVPARQMQFGAKLSF